MKDYEDEAFDELEKAQQRKVAHGVTDGSKVTIDRAKLEYSIKENCTFLQTPKAVGAWVLYDSAPQKMKFMVYAKPTDEQIKNTEALLGWKWEDV
jgi:hypothetical protein